MYGMVTSHAGADRSTSLNVTLHGHHQHSLRSQGTCGPSSCAAKDLQTKASGQRRPTPKSRSVYRRVVNLVKQAWTGVKVSLDDVELYQAEGEEAGRHRPQGIQALCRSTKFTRDELQLLYRGFKQACPTGKVTESVLRDIYAKFFPHGDTSRYAHYVFNSFDNDKSGEITFEEFAFSLSALLRGSMEDKITWTFNLYDIDHDGRITKEEMLNVVSSIYSLLGKSITPQVENNTARLHVEKVFQKLDLNKDGVVTLEEFVEVCTKV